MNLGIGLGVTNYLRVPTVALDPDAAIAALFSSGEEGAWYDPSDSTTVWQDAAGTIAATVGDPVGRIDDKSGNGNHATQSTSTARPTLQSSGGLYYLDFDGVDDYLETATITIPTSTDFSLGMGFTYLSLPADVQTALSWGGYVSNGFAFQTSKQSATTYKIRLARNRTTFVDGTLNNIGDPYVWTVENSSTGAEGRKNAVSDLSSATVTSVGSHVLSLGYRKDSNSQWADINLYGTVAINRTLTAGEIGDLESYLATKSGVTLP